MTLGRCIICALAALLVGTGLGYWLVPTKIKTVERIVTKEVIKKIRNVDTTTTTTTKPDGTTTVVVVDKTKEREDTTVDTKTDKSKVVTKENKDWLVGGGVALDKSGNKTFLGSIERRILGEVYVGGFGTSDGKFGLGLSLRF